MRSRIALAGSCWVSPASSHFLLTTPHARHPLPSHLCCSQLDADHLLKCIPLLHLHQASSILHFPASSPSSTFASPICLAEAACRPIIRPCFSICPGFSEIFLPTLKNGRKLRLALFQKRYQYYSQRFGMTLTRSKRSKRLLRWLSVLQNEDQPLGPSTALLIKYSLLHNHHRCIQVTIRLAGSLNFLHHLSPCSDLPHFLQSQLEAQKIADGSRLWTKIAPILTFIRFNSRSTGSSRGYPTLFVWYSRENHRSYLFFAFLETKMAPVTYSAQELLRMKSVPARKEIYDELCQKLQKHLSLGTFVRLNHVAIPC